MKYLLISKISFIIKVIIIAIIYLTVFFALKIMFKDMKKSDEKQEREDTLGYSGGERLETEHTFSYNQGEHTERDYTMRYDQGERSEREYTMRYNQGERIERDYTMNYSRGERPERDYTMKYSQGEQPEREYTVEYNQGERPEKEYTMRYGQGEQPAREDNVSYSQEEQAKKENTFSQDGKEQLEKENIPNYNQNSKDKEEYHEAVYSPLIDRLIAIWKYIENIYNKQLKKKRAFVDAQNINKPKNKYYNKIIYSPISGKVYNSYYNHIFMNLVLVLIMALAFIILFLLELKFPFKLIAILPGAVIFLYLCKLYNYLSPFISRTKVLKRSLIYINEKNGNEPVVSPVEGVISSLKENDIEIKTSFGINVFIAIKHTKWIEMFVNEGDKISLGEKLFEFGAESEVTPIVFFYIGCNRPHKIKYIKRLNEGIVKQSKALFLVTCIINENAPILNNGDIISLSSYSYGDNEYGSKIVTANFEKDGYLMANCNWIDSWEKFLVVSQSDGTVALKSLHNDKYVSTNLNYGGKLTASGDNVDTSERFIFIGEEQGTYSIIALANNRVVSANFNVEGFLAANRDHISICERFFIWKH